MSWMTLRPLAEQTQDAVYGFGNGTSWPWDDVGTRRSAPAEMPFVEYDPDYGGWWQGDRKLRHFRPKKYFTRPHDGKRPGAMGRFKDALTGRGADVFITLSGDTRTLMRDRPQRWQWTNDGLSRLEILEKRLFDKDHRPQDEMMIDNAPWTWHREAANYNFRTRRFEYPSRRWLNPDHFWRDAHWAPGAKHCSDNPLCKKDLAGIWQTRVPWWASNFAGGRPRFSRR